MLGNQRAKCVCKIGERVLFVGRRQQATGSKQRALAAGKTNSGAGLRAEKWCRRQPGEPAAVSKSSGRIVGAQAHQHPNADNGVRKQIYTPSLLEVSMSDINPMAGCGFFCAIWLISMLTWKTTAVLLLTAAATALLWKSLRFRKPVAIVAFILLVMHLGNTAYFLWLHP